MNTEIDCDNTNEVVCPYCGHEHSDSWEYFSRNEEGRTVQCDDCGSYFRATQCISVDYSTSKLPCLNGEAEHRWSAFDTWFADSTRRYCRNCGKEEIRKVSEK